MFIRARVSNSLQRKYYKTDIYFVQQRYCHDVPNNIAYLEALFHWITSTIKYIFFVGIHSTTIFRLLLLFYELRCFPVRTKRIIKDLKRLKVRNILEILRQFEWRVTFVTKYRVTFIQIHEQLSRSRPDTRIVQWQIRQKLCCIHAKFLFYRTVHATVSLRTHKRPWSSNRIHRPAS